MDIWIFCRVESAPPEDHGSIVILVEAHSTRGDDRWAADVDPAEPTVMVLDVTPEATP